CLRQVCRQRQAVRRDMAAMMRAEERAAGDAAAAERDGRACCLGAAEMFRADAERHVTTRNGKSGYEGGGGQGDAAEYGFHFRLIRSRAADLCGQEIDLAHETCGKQ